ncbi:MAG TPA: DMT family transporter [Chloroflexota bacterium]|jgi:drug/metabolite transporter (DMT)-like permease|nr:DMT family transporter [Chloroflexota bacterium]
MDSTAIGVLAGLVSSFCWALTTLSVRELTHNVSAVVVNGLRTAIAAVLTLFIAVPFWTVYPPAPPRWSSLAFMGLSVMTGLAFGDAIFFESVRRIGVARAMPIAMSFPLISTLLAALFLEEPLTFAIVGGTLLVIAGVGLVVTEKNGHYTVQRADRAGYLLAGATAICWGLTAVLVRPSLEDMDVLTASAVRLPFASLLMLLVIRGRAIGAIRELTPRLWLLILGAGVLSVGATLLFVTAISLAGAGKTASVSATSPLFAAPLAALFLKEPLTLRLTLGTVVSAVGVWLLL